ncbi:GHMP family kinase ATP-binding protein [Peptoclostridium acidaminophilum]|uniref:GHMP family kinase ATP-binding protein n=1 Tax=Peptoclostridium acidaminophilum TaxID=1731 RepID=UPI00046D1364|nr:hypothetical protein [Peptoclostridium acidaminophilum]
MVTATCPASCGELLQGYIEGGEKLISLPIDLYTRVTLTEATSPIRESRLCKSYAAVEATLEHLGYRAGDADGLTLTVESQVPRGKGMASSTADIAASAVAAAAYAGRSLSEMELAAICASIEPTDSTIFRRVTLFDHVKGRAARSYGEFPGCNVMVLEGRGCIDTLEFHKLKSRELIAQGEREMKKALLLFEEGMASGDLGKIGQSATISAIEREKVLKKPGLEWIIETALKLGAYGVNAAHSGSVLGILCGSGFDSEKFEALFWNQRFSDDYCCIRSHRVAQGGAFII